MSNIGIEAVRNLAEPAYGYLWEVSCSRIPGGGDPQDLTFRAKTTSLPDKVLESAETNFKGHKIYHPGRDASAHTVDMTFWDSIKFPVYKALLGWNEFILNRETGAAHHKIDAEAIIIMEMLDKDVGGTVTNTCKLYGAYPESIAAISLDQSSNEIVEISATFKFDRSTFE